MGASTIIGLSIALGTLVVTAWLGRARLEHERSLADISDARAVLADAAVELRRLGESLAELQAGLGSYRITGDMRPSNSDKLLEDASERFRDLQGGAMAVRIRLPEKHPALVELDAASEAAIDLLGKSRFLEFRPADGAPYRADAEQANALMLKFMTARDAYLTQAQRAVGSLLARPS
jgi:hypothetical protein